MSLNGSVHQDGQHMALLAPLTITTAVTAVTTTPVTLLSGMKHMTVQANLTYGSGGTTVDVYVQTSLDGGVTWVDLMNFNFTTASLRKVSSVNCYIAPASQGATATDGTLASNTIIQGTLGDRLRLKYTSVGTYGGSTSLRVDAVVRG